MASYLLRDQDSRDITIPAGKTTIGRGPFLGVSDKRVSRSHAVLELSDGKLTVLPLHANPTFFKASVKDKFVALKKNETQVLVSGNIISLLPDGLCFEIIYKGVFSNNDLTTEEVNTSKEETADPSSAVVTENNEEPPAPFSKVCSDSFLDEFMDGKPSLEAANLITKSRSKDDRMESFDSTHSIPTTSKGHTISSYKSHIEPAQLLQKTRKLPTWLMKSTNSEAESPAKERGGGKGKAPVGSKVGKTAQKTASKPQKKQAKTVSDEEFIARDDDDDDESRHLKEKGKGIKTIPKRTSSDMQKNDNDVKVTKYKRTKQVTLSADEDVHTGTAKNNPAKRAKREATDELSSDEDVKPASGSEKKETKAPDQDKHKSINLIRPPCPYGTKCYRKNPVHFKEYSHPGDSDTAKAAEDSDDGDRPECPYGTSCYRKNPQHIKDFKHSKAPDRPKRSKPKQKRVLDDESDDDEPNTYDYNDSFIDDVEEGESSYSAGSDGSDWQPQAGDDDDDDDDVNELLTEARGFLRSKKMAKPV